MLLLELDHNANICGSCGALIILYNLHCVFCLGNSLLGEASLC